MPRELSVRETAYVNGLITDLCRKMRIDEQDEEYRNAAWDGFMCVYRSGPRAFLHSEQQGWRKAVKEILRCMQTVKTERDNGRYRDVSLDAPISPEAKATRLDLYRGVYFDFQNSVCFWDFLNRLDEWSHDAKLLAIGLAYGETLDEIRAGYRWDHDRIDRAMEILRLAMREYLDM